MSFLPRKTLALLTFLTGLQPPRLASNARLILPFRFVLVRIRPSEYFDSSEAEFENQVNPSFWSK
jgi:hypothetical protein